MIKLPPFVFVVPIAALAAYLGNLLLFRVFGQRAAVYAVPWWEEACKFAASFWLPGVLLQWIALGFGVLELGYDWWRGPEHGFFLGMIMLAGHGLFGALATLVLAGTGNTLLAFLAAGLTHALYNLLVLRLVLPAMGLGAYAGAHKR